MLSHTEHGEHTEIQDSVIDEQWQYGQKMHVFYKQQGKDIIPLLGCSDYIGREEEGNILCVFLLCTTDIIGNSLNY